jgi:hypothetical protein
MGLIFVTLIWIIFYGSVYAVAVDWYDQTYPTKEGEHWFINPETLNTVYRSWIRSCGPNVLCRNLVHASINIFDSLILVFALLYTAAMMVVTLLGQPLIVALERILRVGSWTTPGEDAARCGMSLVTWLVIYIFIGRD